MTEFLSITGRPRLLILSSTYPRWCGDPEPAFVHELARRLVGRFDVIALVPHAPGAAREELLDGVHVCRYRYAPSRWESLANDGGMLANLRRTPWKWLLLPGFLIAQWWALRRTVRRFRPQVLHAHWFLPQGLVAVYGAGGLPVLVTSHGSDLHALRGKLAERLRKKVGNRAAALTVVSEALRLRALGEMPGACIQVLPMGVDCDRRFSFSAQKRDERSLLFVGRLVCGKGLDHLIEAWPIVISMCPDACLTVIGSGPELEALMQRAVDLKLQESIHFIGALPQQQLSGYYRRASLFVAPFVEDEGLGLVVAEAMACGCPVLVGDVAGVRDLVNERTGVTVNARDHVALATAIVGLLRDEALRHALGMAGSLHVQKRYAWRVVADNYGLLLTSMVGKRSL